jgi:hypothetical protein
MKTGRTEPSLAAAAKAGLSSILRSLLNQTMVLSKPAMLSDQHQYLNHTDQINKASHRRTPFRRAQPVHVSRNHHENKHKLQQQAWIKDDDRIPVAATDGQRPCQEKHERENRHPTHQQRTKLADQSAPSEAEKSKMGGGGHQPES